MHETIKLLEERKNGARLLDLTLIQGCASAVQRNLTQIEGINRSEKYVGRCAGKSSDVYRKSRSEMFLEWFGSAAIESAEKAAAVKAFWLPVFDYALNRPPVVRRHFFTIQEDLTVKLSQLRTAYLTANPMEVARLLQKIKVDVDEMIHLQAESAQAISIFN